MVHHGAKIMEEGTRGFWSHAIHMQEAEEEARCSSNYSFVGGARHDLGEWC